MPSFFIFFIDFIHPPPGRKGPSRTRARDKLRKENFSGEALITVAAGSRREKYCIRDFILGAERCSRRFHSRTHIAARVRI